jgi:hypothetical protein
MKKWIDIAHPYSKSGKLRLQATFKACREVDKENIEGDFVECGVWRGGNVMVMRWASPSRHCWLYDTFRGMTAPGRHDSNRKGIKADPKRWTGKSAVSEREVVANLMHVGVMGVDKISIIIGDVRRTLKHDISLPEKIAVLRLDTDFYDSTKIEMEVLYPRLSIGGYLIVDDYGHWLGARKAVDEYLGAHNKLTAIDYTGAWMRKEIEHVESSQAEQTND